MKKQPHAVIRGENPGLHVDILIRHIRDEGGNIHNPVQSLDEKFGSRNEE